MKCKYKGFFQRAFLHKMSSSKNIALLDKNICCSNIDMLKYS